MDAIFRRLRDDNFSELPGLVVDATVPFPERLVNELLKESLKGNKNLEAIHVSILGQNRVSANIKSPLWPWPVNLKLKLFRNVDLSGSPKIRAFLENNILLGRLGALLKVLPEGVILYQDQISVDIGSFLKKPEQRQALELVKAVEISTEEGRLIFDIKIQN